MGLKPSVHTMVGIYSRQTHSWYLKGQRSSLNCVSYLYTYFIESQIKFFATTRPDPILVVVMPTYEREGVNKEKNIFFEDISTNGAMGSVRN